MAAHLTRKLGAFHFFRGGDLPEIELAYETWGTLSPAKDNVLLLMTGLSPGSHARSTPEAPEPGWWERMIGPGRPIDTDRWFVVCNSSLGSCRGSTGPASIDPRTGAPYRLGFPVLSIEDIAASSRLLLRSLGVEKVKTVAGSSMGGMTSLAYALLFPEEVERVVSISAALAASPFAIALRSLQREAIRSDPEWKEGAYAPGEGPRRGMLLARKLGLITYRSALEWRSRFDRKRVAVPEARPFGVEFEVEAYLARHAEAFVPGFDANSYLYLSRAMDLFDVAAHGQDLEEALVRIRARRVLIIGVTTDLLFPIEQQEELAGALSSTLHDVTFVRLPSIQGHDAFLVDIEHFGPPLAAFLDEEWSPAGILPRA